MSETPKYRQIAQDLLRKIQDNTYPLNSLIPREIDLAKNYQVSRPTVRQAVQSLVDLGLLEKRKHRGTLVKSQHLQQQFMQVIENFNQEIDQKGLIPQTKVLFFQLITASKNLAEQMQIKPQDPVFKLKRLRYANHNPLVMVTTYLPQALVAGIEQENFNQVSLYQWLEANGQEVVRVRRQLEVKAASTKVAKLLQISPKDPIFYFHTWGFNQQKQIVEYSLASYRGDLNSFVIDLDRKSPLNHFSN